MKKINLTLLSFASFGFVCAAYGAEPQKAAAPAAMTALTPAQVADVEKVIAEYLMKNPGIISATMQAEAAAKQQEALEKMQKAVAENKDKIFKNSATPVAGNPSGSKTLVVFMDPYCGYCKKFHAELPDFLKANKDVKIIFKDIPIMGEDSTTAVQAMFAAKAQGKYKELQEAIFASEKHLSKEELFKLAATVGVDAKALEKAMEKKEVLDQVAANQELAQTLGVTGTPTLIIGETQVIPGYKSAEELTKIYAELPAAS